MSNGKFISAHFENKTTLKMGLFCGYRKKGCFAVIRGNVLIKLNRIALTFFREINDDRGCWSLSDDQRCFKTFLTENLASFIINCSKLFKTCFIRNFQWYHCPKDQFLTKKWRSIKCKARWTVSKICTNLALPCIFDFSIILSRISHELISFQ